MALPPSALPLGLSAESEGDGRVERWEKLFQKCPVTPCKVLCLDWRTMPTGAAFPLAAAQTCRGRNDAQQGVKHHGA